MSTPRCQATTRRGSPCSRPALPGHEFCRAHLELVPLDPAAADQIVAFIRSGSYVAVACGAAGVSRETFERWLRRDESFRARVARAQSEAEVASIAVVTREAREGSWTAAAWLLERQFPERWGRPATREGEKSAAPVTGPDWLDELASKRAARRSRR